MNPQKVVTAVKGSVVKLECGHVIVLAHDGLPPAGGTRKHCVQCGHTIKVFRQSISRAKKAGVDFSEGPCSCGHSREQHAYAPRCGGSIACTVCTCNDYDEKAAA